MEILSSITSTEAKITFAEFEAMLKEKGLLSEKQKLEKISLDAGFIGISFTEGKEDQTCSAEPSARLVLTPKQEESLKKELEDLDLSVRAMNCIKAAKILSIRELVQYSKEDLSKFRDFGPKSIDEIERELYKRGLYFGMNIDT